MLQEISSTLSSDVFHALYRDACVHVARLAFKDTRPGGLLLPSAFVNLILQNMNLLYEEYLAGKSTAEIHLKGSKLS
jgi:hypothetical protein